MRKTKSFIIIISILLLIGGILSQVSFKTSFDSSKNIFGLYTIDKCLDISCDAKTAGSAIKTAEFKLTKFETSIIDAYAEGVVILYQDDYKVFSGAEFYNKFGSLENLDYYISIWTTETKEELIKNVTTECVDKELENKTIEKIDCKEIINPDIRRSYTVSYWRQYKGELLKSGEYKWRIDMKRPVNKPIDFILIEGISDKKLDSWAWLNTSWAKKKIYNITYVNPTPTYNYSLYINVSFESGDMMANFSDIRWSNSTENGELSFYLDKKTDSQSALFYVKMPSIQGNTSVYLYYSNPNAASKSSFNDAFMYGDDFETNTTDNYEKSGDCDYFYALDGHMKISTSSGANMCQISPKTNFQRGINNYTMEYNFSSSVVGSYSEIAILANSTDWQDFGIYGQTMMNSAAGIQLAWGWDAGIHSIGTGNTNKGYQPNIYYLANLTSMGNTTINYNFNGSFIVEGTSTYRLTGNYGFGFYNGAPTTHNISWVRVKSWVPIAPTYSAGTEESGSDTTAPTIDFNSQVPADLNITNAQNNPVKISYNITDDTGLNYSSVVLYYKANSTSSNIMYFLNGSSFTGYFSSTDFVNITKNYTWTLLDNAIYPGTFNTGAVTIDNKQHTSVTLNSPNQYYRTEYYNISSDKQWGYFEIMANSTATANPSSLYYCNNSYTTGQITSSPYCSIVATRAAITTKDHCHTNASCHIGFQFAINTTSKSIGSVKMTNTSYFLFGGAANWNIFYINELTRANMTKSTNNRGVTWTTDTFTIDQHLHQFDNSDNQTFYYYACANDTAGNQKCSSVRSDTMEMVHLPPTSVNFINPTEYALLSGLMLINYTASISPSNLNISHYNISLLDINYNFLTVIIANNSLNLGYIWDTNTVSNGIYIIRVTVYDQNNQTSQSYSNNFTIENTHNQFYQSGGVGQPEIVKDNEPVLITSEEKTTLSEAIKNLFTDLNKVKQDFIDGGKSDKGFNLSEALSYVLKNNSISIIFFILLMIMIIIGYAIPKRKR